MCLTPMELKAAAAPSNRPPSLSGRVASPTAASNANGRSKAKGSSCATSSSKQQRGKGKSGKQQQQMAQNRNLEAVNNVSPELLQWMCTEIKNLNPCVSAVYASGVAHLLLRIKDDKTVKDTAYDTFGISGEVDTFVSLFLLHRSNYLQMQKSRSAAKLNAAHGGGKKKKKNKSRR